MWWHRIVSISQSPTVLIAGAAILSTVNLSTAPPLWWDEGWTLSVARNLVETGHYGRFLAGEPIPPGLSAAPTVMLPVALSFRIFGVGVWQGRLPGVVFTALALWLLYRLTTMLYSSKAGTAALALALLTPMHPGIHPLLVGRQVLAEMPCLCFLLGGYLLLFRGLEANRAGEIVGAGLLLSLAAVTKLQAVPFLIMSLGSLGIALLLQRKRRSLALYTVAVLLTVTGYLLWRLLYARLALHGSEVEHSGLSLVELLGVTAFVPTLTSRVIALMVVVLWGLPIVASLAYTARHDLDLSKRGVPRLTIWTLAAAWGTWFLVLSVGWDRYFFPAAFLGLFFFAGWLADITDDFDAGKLMRLWRHLPPTRWRRLKRAERLAVCLMLVAIPASLTGLIKTYTEADGSVLHLAAYLRSEVPAAALIETYEPEIMFLTSHLYHFPPDQVHVQLNRRTFLVDPNAQIDYDPLAAEPDYLIDGKFSKLWELYTGDLLSQHFILEEHFGTYDLYRFVGGESVESPGLEP